jgi:diguanylate cyclase (GGDEF)-like protein
VIDLDPRWQFVNRDGLADGERLLREVARRLQLTCRAGDLVVRQPGDQFMVLAPHTNAAQANVLARRLWITLESIPDEQDLGVTLQPSIGAAELARGPNASATSLIEAAEQALLIARVRRCGVLVLGREQVHEKETTVGNEDKARIRENRVAEPDGSESVQLDVFCPDCSHWHAVDGRRRVRWGERAVKSFGERPFVHGPPNDARVADVMTREVTCVRPDMSIELCSELLLERKISAAPVLDKNGNLLGLVATNDILRAASDATAWGRATVTDIMTPIVFKLERDASVIQAAALMAYESVQRVVVVSPDGKVEGVLSSTYVLRWLAHSVDYAVPQRREDAPATAARRTGPILVVDDDQELRDGVAELLREEGYEVTTAANGAEALSMLQLSTPPSLILLDLTMPVMSGAVLCNELSKDPALDRIPLVLLSGAEHLAGEVGRIDADAFLSKPVEVERLLGTVRRYC